MDGACIAENMENLALPSHPPRGIFLTPLKSSRSSGLVTKKNRPLESNVSIACRELVVYCLKAFSPPVNHNRSIGIKR
jgi:hypothetical protein